MSRKFGWAIVAGLLLAGCSGGGSHAATSPTRTSTGSVASSTPTTPSPTSSPLPTELSKKAAGALYLRYVTPLNKAQNSVTRAQTRHDLAGLRAGGKRGADAEFAFVQALLNNQFPAEVDYLAKQLAGELAPEISSFRELSKAKSLTKAQAILDSWPGSDNGTAQQIRALLGLPEAPA